jgi:hypothetical protein
MLASPEPSSSVSSPSSTSFLPAKFTMLDLELLHFWTTETVQASIDFTEGVELFRTTIVQWAFEYPFLMHEFLAMAAIHLAHLRPQKRSHYRHAADSHSATALSLFQPEIANLTAENCHACFAFATNISMHAWAAQELDKPSSLFFKPSSHYQSANVQWVKLHRGTNTILTTLWSVIEKGPLNCLFADWAHLDPDRPDPLLPEEEKPLNSLHEAWKTSALSDQQKELLDKTLKATKRTFSMLYLMPGPSKLATGISWFAQISDEFIQMVADKIPEALLIVVYYCVVLKKLGDTWWLVGKAENLLRTVMTELGGGWETWTRWPIEQVLGEDGVLHGLEFWNGRQI